MLYIPNTKTSKVVAHMVVVWHTGKRDAIFGLGDVHGLNSLTIVIGGNYEQGAVRPEVTYVADRRLDLVAYYLLVRPRG